MVTAVLVALVVVALVVAGIACRTRAFEPGEKLDRFHQMIYGRTRRGR